MRYKRGNVFFLTAGAHLVRAMLADAFTSTRPKAGSGLDNEIVAMDVAVGLPYHETRTHRLGHTGYLAKIASLKSRNPRACAAFRAGPWLDAGLGPLTEA